MVNKFCLVGCRSNYKREEIVAAFSFPSDEDTKNRWIKFVIRKDCQPTPSAVICIKHFEGKFLKKGEHKKGLDWLKHWNQYQQFTQHQWKHLPHLKYLFQENLQRKEFFKKINMINLKGTTILLVWKVLLNQAAHIVIFTPNMKIMLSFKKSF